MTKFDPHTATQQELRDWLAEQDGWAKVKDVYGGDAWRKRSLLHDPHSNWSHPYPRTLDGAAAALPEGMRAERRYCEHMSRWTWAVLEQMPSDVWLYRVSWVPDTGDRITDEYRLACLARVAMKEKAQ